MGKTRCAFYWEWCWRSFWGPVGWAQAVGFVVMVMGSMWALFDPTILGTLTPLLWMVPGAVFLATFIVAWWLAPFVMYRELELKSAAREATLTNALRGEISPEERARQQAEARAEKIEATYRSHADNAPVFGEFSSDLGCAWWQGARQMVEDHTPVFLHRLQGVSNPCAYHELARSVGSLRSIAGDLRPEHLRN